MSTVAAFLNDPNNALQLHYAVGATIGGLLAIAIITTLLDRRRGRG